jgi:hypothetical protein
MVKPPTSVRSIRLPDELWERLAKRAEETGQSVNALMAIGARAVLTSLIHRVDMERAEPKVQPRSIQVTLPPPPTVAQRHEAGPGTASNKLNVPLAGTFTRKPYQKGGKK